MTQHLKILLVIGVLVLVSTPAGAEEASGPEEGATPENTSVACQDGSDNDGDGQVDCDDQDCRDLVFCVECQEESESPSSPFGGVTTESSAPQPAEQAQSQRLRRIHVESIPPGALVAMDQRTTGGRLGFELGWNFTPMDFEASPGMHNVTLDSIGHSIVTIPIPTGTEDLLVEVELSRPVHEWGIGLSSLGGLLVVIGMASLIAGGVNAADRRAEWETDEYLHESYPTVEDFCSDYYWYGSNCWEGELSLIGANFMGFGGATLLAGLLMTFLDRNRTGDFTITPI